MTQELFGTAFGQQQTALDQARLNEQVSLSRLHGANADALEAQTARAQKMLALLAQPEGEDQSIRIPDPTFVGPRQPGSAEGTMAVLGGVAGAAGQDLAAIKLAKHANRLIDAGFVDEGGKLANEAAQIVLRGQQLKTSASRGAFDDMRVRREQLTEINALIAGVEGSSNPVAAYNQARAIFMANHPELAGNVPAILRAPYNPNVINIIKNGTAEGLKRIEADRRALEEDSRIEHRSAQEIWWNTRETYMNRRLDQIDRDLTRKERNAGTAKPVGAPKTSDVAMATSIIESEFPEASDKSVMPEKEKAIAAYDIAARALAIGKNSGIDAGEAMRLAFEELRPGFQQIAETYKKFGGFKIPGTGTGPQIKYKRGASQTLDLPTNPKELSLGKDYKLKDGTVGTWTGQGFVRKGAPKAAPRAAPPSDDEDDGEE
jgi:hypothetical protein